MSFHGGLLGVIVSIIFFSKKTKTNFFKFADIVSCVAPIGIFLGRIANFINGELYGKISTLPWAVIFPNGGSMARHPSQIYEAILEGIILFVLINYFALKKKLLFKTGYISGLFLVSYSILRMLSEIFREPDMHLGLYFNYFSLGILMAAYSFAQFIAAPLLGHWSDRYGRKRILVLSKLGTVVSYLILAFSSYYVEFWSSSCYSVMGCYYGNYTFND